MRLRDYVITRLLDAIKTSAMFYLTAFVLLCVARCLSAVQSTCEVNITDQESFALLTCRFSKPVKDFILELKGSTDGEKKSLGLCSSKTCVRLSANYVLFPNKEEYFHSASLGIMSGTDSPEGSYSCIPMDESNPSPAVQVCHLSSLKRLTGVYLTSSCNADPRDVQQVEVRCTFSKLVRYFQVEVFDGPDSSPDPVAVCRPEGCSSLGDRYRVINDSSDLRSIVMARDPKEAIQQKKFRCRPFVTADAFRAENCAVLTSLTSLTSLTAENVSSEHTSPVMSTCTVEVVEEGAVHVLSCSFPSETNSYLVELNFSTGSNRVVQCTRNQCNSSENYVFTPRQKASNREAEVHMELPLEQRTGSVEYRCLPRDVTQVQSTGCCANFSQPPTRWVTTEASTGDKVPGKETLITADKGDRSNALVHIIVTGSFIGISTIAVIVALAVVIRLLKRRVYEKQSWANNVFSGLSAPRVSGPTHHESGNIYDEIPSRQWHKQLVSIETADIKAADAVNSRCSLPPVDLDKGNNMHEICTHTPAALSDPPPESSPHSILHQQNAIKSKDIVRSSKHSLPPSDPQTIILSLPSQSSSEISGRLLRSANDLSSSLSSSQRSSLPLSSDSSSAYLHPVSEVSITLDLDVDIRARQRALYQILDCGYLDFKFYEVPPKPCSPRLQRAARKMDTRHNRWSQ